ncbi:hypothetical protein [Hydrogenophaga electricum]|uniref:Uncharacterized protein n=1 Tax=Hydrogenophaga electricum TaxID=1230953 RepID=A0ABQ6CAX6_9BURK|nr:hypothetical protein [Hydrogenophaga electricum]GLS15925.1 hypothetical protein GCM10007935_33620 [Hydrogenophaga electricum]
MSVGNRNTPEAMNVMGDAVKWSGVFMPVDEALQQGAVTHLAEAVRQHERWQGAGRSVLPAQEMAGAVHAHV